MAVSQAWPGIAGHIPAVFYPIISVLLVEDWGAAGLLPLVVHFLETRAGPGLFSYVGVILILASTCFISLQVVPLRCLSTLDSFFRELFQLSSVRACLRSISADFHSSHDLSLAEPWPPLPPPFGVPNQYRL